MLKFFLGLAAGVVVSIAYVLVNFQLPEFVQLPWLLKNSVISSATEDALYDLDNDPAARMRALEVYFANRSADAAALDAAAGHPVLTALMDRRATREARLVSGQWTAFDAALDKPALRGALERRHGTTDTEQLKLAMLMTALEEKPFLKRWLEEHSGPVTRENIRALLAEAAVDRS